MHLRPEYDHCVKAHKDLRHVDNLQAMMCVHAFLGSGV